MKNEVQKDLKGLRCPVIKHFTSTEWKTNLNKIHTRKFGNLILDAIMSKR